MRAGLTSKGLKDCPSTAEWEAQLSFFFSLKARKVDRLRRALDESPSGVRLPHTRGPHTWSRELSHDAISLGHVSDHHRVLLKLQDRPSSDFWFLTTRQRDATHIGATLILYCLSQY